MFDQIKPQKAIYTEGYLTIKNQFANQYLASFHYPKINATSLIGVVGQFISHKDVSLVGNKLLDYRF